MDYLKEHPGVWLSAKQVAAGMSVGNADIIRAILRKLKENRQVRFVMSDMTMLYRVEE